MWKYLRIGRTSPPWTKGVMESRATNVRLLPTVSVTGILALLVIGSFLISSLRESSSAAASPVLAHSAVVIAELFTSEGCSSCPPADELLTRLVQEQPVKGVTVLGLSENVDYWNRLGWVDPFSSSAFSRRQSEYATQVFRNDGVYTPQMIIDGRLEEVGSNAEGVYRKIAQAAEIPKAAMNIAATLARADSVLQIQAEVEVPREVAFREPANVILAITEDNLASDVHQGENRGRFLRHNAVVRCFQTVGDLKASTGSWSQTISIRLAPEWRPENLKVIGFLQEQQSRRIIGAGWSKVR